MRWSFSPVPYTPLTMISITPVTVLSTIFASLIVYTVWYTVLHDQLRKVPGPILARYSDIWLTLQARLGRRYRSVHAAHLVCLYMVLLIP